MDIEKYNKRFTNKEYAKGRTKETKYYIITAKLEDSKYKLTLLRNHSVFKESYYNGLTVAKNNAFKWIINHDPSIFTLNKVTMVHYKEDGLNGDNWVDDTNIELHKNLEAYFRGNKNIISPTTFVNEVATSEEILNQKEKTSLIKRLEEQNTSIQQDIGILKEQNI